MTAPASQRARGTLGRTLAIVAGIVVMAAVAGSFLVTSSPMTLRAQRLDQRRATDLGDLHRAIHAWYRKHGALPATLDVVAKQPGVRLALTDPVTEVPYTFAITGTRTYRLCAIFTTDTALQESTGYPQTELRWAHGVGQGCFDRDATTATGDLGD